MKCPTVPSNLRLSTVIVLPISSSIPARNVTPDADGPTVGANCRVIVLLARVEGTKRCMVERGWKRRGVAGGRNTVYPGSA